MASLVCGELMSLCTQASAEQAGGRLATLILCLSMIGGIAVTFGLLRLIFLREQKKQRAESRGEDAQTGPAPGDDAGEG